MPRNRGSFAAALMVLIAPLALTPAVTLPLAAHLAIGMASILGYAALIWRRVLTGEERDGITRLLRSGGLLGMVMTT